MAISEIIHPNDDRLRLTEVDATPSHPLGALVEVQSPRVAACELLLSDVVSLLAEFVSDVSTAALPVLLSERVSELGEGVVVEEPVAVSPGCWHCQEESGAQAPPSCSRHCE